ncbi:Ankyrin repeat-containing protein [Quillaja saponaria]|uniref:Ankyrin repeat-containing protein n=1 Tax=Quillaja saponaria TaxID=32244 RepID=A0AAD7LGL4_QUISA|nr:Ankyrin repeat-containing protein [Quillaja saponaria]
MPPSNFPLRWESTSDQWWYASPIDWAAANGLYDVVRELLHLDTNLLIKLTSLRRIRRLETVWDDEAQFDDVAKCRSQVARKLLLECETEKGYNSLIRAGYGGWLLYTAASAGDIDFIKELIERDPLLVFGEGEYGVTDILYAAARSKNCDVLRLLLDFALSPRNCLNPGEELDEGSSLFKWEMMNRAIHAAARGGNLNILKELLGNTSDVLAYRDAQGSTILHTASGRGQIEVVKDLVASFDIITSTDGQGNTALHVASYRGYLPVVEILALASPSVTSLTNNYGDTFLHMAVAGFRSPGFRRLDKHIELVKELVCGNLMNPQDIINVRNNDGRTVLHMAVIENIQTDIVELLMSVPSIDLNIRDADGMTPLDLLKQRPKSASSEILIKQLISAGGITKYQDYMARSAIVTHLKTQGIGSSPGTSFRIPDAEIFLYTGIENASDASCTARVNFDTCSGGQSIFESANSLYSKKSGSIDHAARHLKFLLRWPGKKERKEDVSEIKDDDSFESFSLSRNLEDNPIPLRQRYSKLSSLLNNKRTVALGGYIPSPSSKQKFTAGLMHGVIQVAPHLALSPQSPSSPFSGSSVASPTSFDKQKGIEMLEPSCSNESVNGNTPQLNYKQSSLNKKLMNQYFCVGAHGLAVEDSDICTRSNQSCTRFSSLVV